MSSADETPCGPEQHYADEEMLTWLQSFVEMYGIAPVHNDLVGWPGPSAQTYIKRFGGLDAALREAGIEPRGDADE